MKKVTKFLILAVLIVASIYIAYKIGLERHITLENLKAKSFHLQKMVLANYYFSVAIYMLIYFIVIAFALPATGPMSLIGGFLFGAIRCTIYATIAATAGATISFLFLRTVFRKTIADKYANQLNKFRKGIDEYGSFYLLILHFLLVLPFFLINSLAALADISLLSFMWTTALGIIPAAFIYAFAGQQITTIQSADDILSAKVIIALVLLIAFIVGAMLLKRYKKQ